MKTKAKLNKSHIQGGIATLIVCVMVFSAVTLTHGLFGSQSEPFNGALNTEQKEAADFTREINRALYTLLDFENTQESEFAARGLMAAPERLEIHNADGKVIWSQKAFEFVRDTEAPDTANPSLWRNTQLNIDGRRRDNGISTNPRHRSPSRDEYIVPGHESFMDG